MSLSRDINFADTRTFFNIIGNRKQDNSQLRFAACRRAELEKRWPLADLADGGLDFASEAS